MDICCNRASAPGEDPIADADPSERETPLKAIRLHCLWCSRTSHEVGLCVSRQCPLWLYRFGRRPTPNEVAAVTDVETHPREASLTQAGLHEYTPLRAIRRRCLDCSGGPAEVRECTFTPEHKANPCSLHPHRMRTGGKRATGEELEAKREQFARLKAGRSLA